MTNSHHSLYLEWCDAVGATYSNRQNLWSQFSSAQIHPLSNPWLEISPEVLEKVNSELSDSRYVDHLDKLGKMWLCLGSKPVPVPMTMHISKRV